MDIDDLKKLESRFIFFIPRELDLHDISYRDESEKWSTLRFYTEYGGKKLRVKEFFLDWFYTSFPKNLMKSFVNSYSDLNIYKKDGRKIFIGKDYKGILASSSYLLGTQIEIEGEDVNSIIGVNMLMHPLQNYERFKKLPYHERSFFARNKAYNWFEEERIARMKWKKPENTYSIAGSDASSIGTFNFDGQNYGITLIFSNDYFTRVFWLEIARLSSTVPYGYYILRKNGNLYKFIEMKGGLIGYIDKSGPGIWQRFYDKYVVTIAFSSDISTDEFISEFDNIHGIIDDIVTKYF